MERLSRAEVRVLNRATEHNRKVLNITPRPPTEAIKHRILGSTQEIFKIIQQSGEEIADVEVEGDRILIRTTSDNI